MIKRGLTLVNALNITPHISISGRLDGSTELARTFGTWERILGGQPDG